MIKKKTKVIDTEHYKKATQVQSIHRGNSLRKKFRNKLKRFVFGKSLIAFIRRIKRKIIIRPIFQGFRNIFALKFNIRMNLHILTNIQRRVKKNTANRIYRKHNLHKLLTKMVKKRWGIAFRDIKMKNQSPEMIEKYTNEYGVKVNFKNKLVP